MCSVASDPGRPRRWRSSLPARGATDHAASCVTTCRTCSTRRALGGLQQGASGGTACRAVASAGVVAGRVGHGKELFAHAVPRRQSAKAMARCSDPSIALGCRTRCSASSPAAEGAFTRRACTQGWAGGDRARQRRCSSTRSATFRATLQAKLLRLLEGAHFGASGGVETRQADVRVVAATTFTASHGP